jgi:alpha-ketoglutarate-dependent taurine dioxygenase
MAAVMERQTIEVRPTGAALGADIGGVDLAQELSPETVDAIKQACPTISCCGFAANVSTTTS